jgi:hypothetical protein
MLKNLSGHAPSRSTGSFLLGLATFAFTLVAASSFGANPFITSIYTADPSAHVWPDGRLYVYPSHDVDPPRGCDLMDRYHVFSTDDMVNWRDEGEILRASQVSWGRPQGGFMWAPDCAYKDGKYFFYFPHPSGTNWNNTWKIGVATSAEPARGFTCVGYIPGVGGFSMIDPSVFVDTDGQAYLYYGGGGHCAGGRLKSNMIEIDGAMQTMTALDDFHEATRVFKRNNLYYLTYADNFPRANRLRYATGASPLGPWTSRGIYLDSTDCDTSHGSVVEYKGQWYAFYHDCSISGRGTLRSICVDQLNFDTNGNILKVVETKTGPAAVGPPPAPGRNTIKYGVKNGAAGNGATVVDDNAAYAGACLHDLQLPDSFLEFDAVDGGAAGGQATIDVGFAALSNAKVRLTVNGVDYSFLNTLSTGGWSAFTGDSSLTVPLEPGATNIIRFTGGHGGVNVDYMTVTPLPPGRSDVRAQNTANPRTQPDQ